MTNIKKAQEFSRKWKDRGDEKQDTQRFWLELLSEVFEDDYVFDHVKFEKPVQNLKSTDYKDVVVTNGKDVILVEQKSIGTDLSKAQKQSDGVFLTPFQQAERYDNNSPITEKARWIVVCNFSSFWIYDMTLPTKLRVTPIRQIFLTDLSKKLKDMAFLVNSDVQKLEYDEEMAVSKEAGDLVAKLYDELLKGYPDASDPSEKTQASLNRLCVQIVFLLYAEDAEILSETESDVFRKYLERYQVDEWHDALRALFTVLNTPYDQRSYGLSKKLSAFPYVNGGLFSEVPDLPVFSEGARELIIEEMSKRFDWSRIIPAIFGAIFEATLNPVTRRSGGMHYTSLENIHKVIDPLFLDELRTEFAAVKTMPRRTPGERAKRETALKALQDKLASLKFLDPAAGSGNFLTESYLCLRRMENEIISILNQGTPSIMFNPIKVSILQFYGIEINSFAVAVARAAMWIAECQMYRETKNVVNFDADFLPLENYENIVEANALRIDWNDVVPANELNYMYGNPPFLGYAMQNSEQKKDFITVAPYLGNNIDYVALWYFKAGEMMLQNSQIKAALVSTNSITQGEQVAAIWKTLFERFDINIDFAYRTFRWDSEANTKAHVHCVIIGFSRTNKNAKKLYLSDGSCVQANEINPYLLDAPTIFVESRKKPICNVQQMIKGSSPVDGGNFFLSEDEYNKALHDPVAIKYVRKYLGAKEFLHNIDRWVLWLEYVNPSDIKKSPLLSEKIAAVRNFRLSSSKAATRKFAEQPTRFMEMRQPESTYLLVPRHSSQNRKYIPIGYMDKSVICGDANNMIPNSSLFQFGILESCVHMNWMKTICGRIKSDFRYSNDIVYNNFPWPSPTLEQKERIEKTAQGILDARSLYPDSSLADLYDPLTMPFELRKAHEANDKVVMEAYGFRKDMTESEIVAELMKMYQKLTATK